MSLHLIAEKVVFFVTLIVVLVLALLPVLRLKEFGFDIGFHYDKLNHGIAFAALMIIGSLGWPERKMSLIIFLALAGAAIEVLQGTTLIGRDLDGFDWAADCVGIACALAAIGCANSLIQRAA
ncbi:hypothetical protein NKI19_29500 [Mesorhizobium sp. M0751]|uniref:hypothetical protein n=1 Tax=unclassified Mesorhizobium TaxID=325217 RepID=UPI00333E1757